MVLFVSTQSVSTKSGILPIIAQCKPSPMPCRGHGSQGRHQPSHRAGARHGGRRVPGQAAAGPGQGGGDLPARPSGAGPHDPQHSIAQLCDSHRVALSTITTELAPESTGLGFDGLCAGMARHAAPRAAAHSGCSAVKSTRAAECFLRAQQLSAQQVHTSPAWLMQWKSCLAALIAVAAAADSQVSSPPLGRLGAPWRRVTLCGAVVVAPGPEYG